MYMANVFTATSVEATTDDDDDDGGDSSRCNGGWSNDNAAMSDNSTGNRESGRAYNAIAVDAVNDIGGSDMDESDDIDHHRPNDFDSDNNNTTRHFARRNAHQRTQHQMHNPSIYKQNERRLRRWRRRQCSGYENARITISYRQHSIFFIIFGICCAIKGNWAGFACLSNPCIFGVCIDDLNRFVCYLRSILLFHFSFIVKSDLYIFFGSL